MADLATNNEKYCVEEVDENKCTGRLFKKKKKMLYMNGIRRKV